MTPATSAQITLVYQQYLGRTPSSAEISYWTGVNGVGATIDDVVHAIFTGGEWRGVVDRQLTFAYQQYLGRDPSASELAYWEGQIAGGMQTGTALDNIRNSPEASQFLQAIASQIQMAYQSWVGRTPTPDEISYWEKAVQNGGTISTALAAIQNSPEAKAHAQDVENQRIAAMTDQRMHDWQNVLQNQVAQTYSDFIGRSATSADLAYWQSVYTRDGNAQAIIDSIKNSDEAKQHAASLSVSTSAGSTATDAATTAVQRENTWNNTLKTAVYSAYAQCVNRSPAFAEVSYWHDVYIRDGNAQAIIDSIKNSDEAKQYAAASHTSVTPSPTPAPTPAPLHVPVQFFQTTGGQFDGAQANLVAEMYKQYLGRDPSADELHYWLGTGADALTLRVQISTSPEAKQYAAMHPASQSKSGGLALLGIAATIFSALKGG